MSICGDKRLGPIKLPDKLLVSIVSNYNRFGPLTPGEFLTKYYNNVEKSWIYPNNEGFGTDSSRSAIKGDMLLQVGTLVDRFGWEKGHYLAAADAPYNQRSIPPDGLNTWDGSVPNNYYLYKVVRSLPVVAGPIAPWFEQPGLGLQFDTSWLGSVAYLVNEGYLQRVKVQDVVLGPGPPKCGR